jgi:hypothetical protein
MWKKLRHNKNWLRAAFAVFGIAAVVFLIDQAGAQKLWNAFLRMAVWFPLVLGIEFLRVACDAENTYQSLGNAKDGLPRKTMFRSELISTAIGSIVPAGRSTQEASKGALISPWVGAASAISAALISQVATFIGGGLITIPSAWVSWQKVGWSGFLTLALLLHSFVLLALARLLRMASGSHRLISWFEKKIPRIGKKLSEYKKVSPSVTSKIILVPGALMFFSRILQTLQMLILFGAVEHRMSISMALLAEGIFMLSLVAGAFIPGEFGTSEGAFVLFAGTLGTHRANALSVALLLHSVKLALILIGCLTPLLWKAPEKAKPEGAAA